MTPCLRPENSPLLVISLVLSAILLLIAVIVMYRSQKPVGTITGWGLGLTLVPLFVMLFFPVVALQAILLVVAARACCWPRRRPGRFILAALASTLAAYGIFAGFVFHEISVLRGRFPYVSMEERLPRSPGSAAPLPAATADRLADLEERIEKSGDRWHYGSIRIWQLQQLHEDAVAVFIRRAGFGVGRMGEFTEWLLDYKLRQETPPQPGERSPAAWSSAALQLQPPSQKEAKWQQELLGMHEEGVVDFVHRQGFGFLKDRRHVAGFQPHQFSEVPPGAAVHSKLQTIDLVGLVRHEEPVAYVSASLPSMEELREAPTRPLDSFEELGLKALRGGETLFVRDTTAGLRALGAIRSVKQCVSCHGGQRGDLLGAFSYTLQVE
jgi:hypothetical protein